MNKTALNKLKANDLQPENNSGGRGSQILPTFSPLSEWGSQTCVRAKLNLFDESVGLSSVTKCYPEILLKLNMPGADGIEHWQRMIADYALETESQKLAFHKIDSLYFQFFGFHRFRSFNSFRAQLSRHVKSMK